MSGCVDWSDCGYLGKCLDGSCVCDHPWTGPECQQLDLAPVPDAAGYQQANTSSWGGSVVRAENGRLYMYASEMVGGCGIGSWTRNSRVVLASADNATSPFRFERELFGVFSHEPVATRAPTGEFVVWFTTTRFGCGTFGPCVPAPFNASSDNPGGPTCWEGCHGGVTAPSCYDIDQDHRGRPSIRFPTFMAWARSPLGPYSTPVMVYNGSDRAGTSPLSGATGDTNMAPVIFGDGSLLGMWRGSRYPDPSQFQYTVTASHWRDAASYRWGAATRPANVFPALAQPTATDGVHNCGLEDPSLWLDGHGIVHAVLHDWTAGGHAASADRGRTWRWFGGTCSPTNRTAIDWRRSVWPPLIRFKSGRSVSPHRRERPHVILGADRRVEAISTATQEQGPPNDRTWTMVQPVTRRL